MHRSQNINTFIKFPSHYWGISPCLGVNGLVVRQPRKLSDESPAVRPFVPLPVASPAGACRRQLAAAGHRTASHGQRITRGLAAAAPAAGRVGAARCQHRTCNHGHGSCRQQHRRSWQSRRSGQLAQRRIQRRLGPGRDGRGLRLCARPDRQGRTPGAVRLGLRTGASGVCRTQYLQHHHRCRLCDAGRGRRGGRLRADPRRTARLQLLRTGRRRSGLTGGTPDRRRPALRLQLRRPRHACAWHHRRQPQWHRHAWRGLWCGSHCRPRVR